MFRTNPKIVLRKCLVSAPSFEYISVILFHSTGLNHFLSIYFVNHLSFQCCVLPAIYYFSVGNPKQKLLIFFFQSFTFEVTLYTSYRWYSVFINERTRLTKAEYFENLFYIETIMKKFIGKTSVQKVLTSRRPQYKRFPTGPGKSWNLKSVLESPGILWFLWKILEKSWNFTQYLFDGFPSSL